MRKYNILIVMLAVSSLLLISCNAGQAKKQDEEVQVESFEYKSVPVKTEDVISDEVYQSIYTIGEIKASEQYQANAMANGDVLEVFFSVGDVVSEGDVLFTIEKTDFEVDKSTSLNQSSNAVMQAKISYDFSKENFENYQKLFNGGVVSQAELDNAENQLSSARISYNNATKSYDSAKYNYKSMGDNYEVTSPASGIITSKNVSEGMYATTQNGFTVDVVEKYTVSSQIASKYINEIKEEQEVELYISTLDVLIKGRIDTISLSGMNGAYPIEIKLDESNSMLKPGMYTDIWVLTNKSSEGLWIPSQALLQENGESFVYTVVEDKAKKITVDVLSMRGDTIAVKSELSKDSKVITFGKEYVMDGSPVEVKTN